MTDADLARRADVPVEIIAPIRTIESGGNPRAFRFECNKFHDRTGHRFESVPCTPAPGVAFSRTPSETNRAAFDHAYLLDPIAAVQASSWGLYQQLGTTLLRLYPTPQAALDAFDRDPRDVSDRLFVRYFQDRPALKEAAQRRDWRALAEGYNGSTRWYNRFVELLGSGGSGGGAGLLIAGLLGAGAWAWWRSR